MKNLRRKKYDVVKSNITYCNPPNHHNATVHIYDVPAIKQGDI